MNLISKPAAASVASMVFVYGTLKGMHQGKFIDHGVTDELFHMWDGGFPVVCPAQQNDENAGVLFGELYAVSPEEMAGLDSYEGYPSLYGREKYQINLSKGGSTEAWIYTGNQIKAHLDSPRRPIMSPSPSGILLWPYGAAKAVPEQFARIAG